MKRKERDKDSEKRQVEGVEGLEDQGLRAQHIEELPAGFEGVEAGGRWHRDVGRAG